MNVLAINGSPRKNWNTATLLTKALEGAASQRASTEIIHLYDHHYQGCISCFACKLKDGKSYGKCAMQDELTPILEKIANADAVILGSPVYFHGVTGEMRSLIERMGFPYTVYDKTYSSLFNKKMPIGFIYTMNVDETRMKEFGYDHSFRGTEMALERIFGACEPLYVNDTYQFSDYSKYVVTAFNEAEKAQRRQEHFPLDCQRAFDLGVKFATAKA